MSERTIGLKMCRPDAEDGETACRIMGILQDVDKGDFPRGIDGEFQEGDPEWFDEDDENHLRVFYRRIKELMNKGHGALTRVIGGMVWCVMYEKNEIIDAASSSLELHPRLVGALTRDLNSVGQWVSVADEMPDDEISVLVWSTMHEDGMVCYHDSEVAAKRGDSGWVLAHGEGPGARRVILGVTHWCGEIQAPQATKSGE